MSKLATLLKRGLRFRYLQENFKRVLRIFSRQLFLQDTFFTWRLILQCAKDLNQCTFSGLSFPARAEYGHYFYKLKFSTDILWQSPTVWEQESIP